jgi:U3 small nucleolar RNA-associated protein 18
MGKHARKRLRKDKPAHKSFAPLGTAVLLDDDADKDDEERRLESLLFGKPLVSGRRSKVTTIEDVSEDGDGVDATAAELEGMLDSDVSYHWHSLAIALRHSFQAFFCGRWHDDQDEYDRELH